MAHENDILNLIADIQSLNAQFEEKEDKISKLKIELENEEDELACIRTDVQYKRDDLDKILDELIPDVQEPKSLYSY